MPAACKRLARAITGTVLSCLALSLPAQVAQPPAPQTAAPKTTAAKTTVPKTTAPQTTAPQTTAPQTTPAAQQALDNLKTQAIITKVKAAYNSGLDNYRANRLDAARLDFDFAIDTMLTSGMDLTTESDLSVEFDNLLNRINSLEMAALKQGNGFSPKIEAAPLDTAEDITFAPNPELVARLSSELNTTSDLPLIINDQVAGYIGVFSTSTSFRAHMAASLQRVGKYRGLIQRVLKEEGVPQDLIYLAVAESGFQPQVVNGRSGAGGMWQFMTFTGAQYGLSRNSYFDYRFDPEKSTRAYAHYIKSLYGQFGDWYLAMAAYNWGPGNIQRVVQRTGYADFWELYRRGVMPAETRAYVPQILAAIIMAKNPERYGLDKLVPSPAVIYDTISTNYSIDLRLVADVTGSTVPEIVALNPSLLRLTTPNDISYDLHIPPGTKELFADRLKDIPQDRRASWRFHVVKSGETIDEIATNLHAHATDIAETNGITSADPMAPGDELVVPVQPVASVSHPSRYTPRRGDTLVTVADRFGVSVEDLRDWNHLSSSSLRAGHALYVAEPVRLAPASRSRSRHASRGSSTHESSRSSSRAAHSEAHSSHRSSSAHAASSGSSHAASSHTASTKHKHR